MAGAADEPVAGHEADADRLGTVGNIITRIVAEKLPAGRLDGLRLIGVDEVNYGADHKFLTCVANHRTGAIAWATEGRDYASPQAFFDRRHRRAEASIRAVSIDMSAEKAIRDPDNGVPHAQVVFDPFHVVQGRHEALPVRAGCETPPSGCRGSPVKLRTA